MKKLKEFLLSDKGMRLVNIVFLLSFLVPDAFFSMAAAMLWLLFLYYSGRRSESKAVKAVYGVFGAIAVLLIVLSLISIFN